MPRHPPHRSAVADVTGGIAHRTGRGLAASALPLETDTSEPTGAIADGLPRTAFFRVYRALLC